MQEEKQFVMKCCICGREKTDRGWEYRFRADEQNILCSHGFCAPCYETEIMKIRLQTTLATVPLYR
ncbi:MAG: hypothetical protein KKE37_05595 [Verrucomicrobia bacterium]|nr:hypothetical protein [Verrucomicrobiota bacterium]MBU4291230.1 hypothetical protein [Verrucomicrobiota bacterium]MBU4428812.1 hypothetical protein [Verrucomicrobiota bacterium]MCG2680957.1 hypothetical protein [Kiritimatiellia bacterium]